MDFILRFLPNIFRLCILLQIVAQRSPSSKRRISMRIREKAGGESAAPCRRCLRQRVMTVMLMMMMMMMMRRCLDDDDDDDDDEDDDDRQRVNSSVSRPRGRPSYVWNKVPHSRPTARGISQPLHVFRSLTSVFSPLLLRPFSPLPLFKSFLTSSRCQIPRELLPAKIKRAKPIVDTT